VQLTKKLMLVLASSTVITGAPAQAAIGFCVNLVYLALLEVKKPMPYRPSTSAWFKGQNFFHLAERSSASTSLAGSLLAILGSLNKSLVDVFGTIFAVLNIAYVCCRLGAREREASAKRKRMCCSTASTASEKKKKKVDFSCIPDHMLFRLRKEAAATLVLPKGLGR